MKSAVAGFSCLSVLCLSVLIVLLCWSQTVLGGSRGSTPNVRAIVLGRCWDFQRSKFGNDAKKWKKNCTAISEAFYRAFAFKSPCELTFADYKPYFDAVGMAENIDKSLFWSGTKEVVHSYSSFDLRYTTLEDTMAGWIVNDLSWCGKNSSRASGDGIDYDACRYCPRSMDAFWGQASKLFAQSASGKVRVMMNGSRIGDDGQPTPAYRNNSYFGRFELPYLDVTRVTKLVVIVVHTVGGEIIEKCGTKSVKLLETLAKKRGLATQCVDDPPSVKHMLCTDFPDSAECLFNSGHTSPATSCRTWQTGVAVIAVLTGILLLTLAIVLVCYCRRLKKGVADMEQLVDASAQSRTIHH